MLLLADGLMTLVKILGQFAIKCINAFSIGIWFSLPAWFTEIQFD
jgi:hypothetical protein